MENKFGFDKCRGSDGFSLFIYTFVPLSVERYLQ